MGGRAAARSRLRATLAYRLTTRKTTSPIQSRIMKTESTVATAKSSSRRRRRSSVGTDLTAWGIARVPLLDQVTRTRGAPHHGRGRQWLRRGGPLRGRGGARDHAVCVAGARRPDADRDGPSAPPRHAWRPDWRARRGARSIVDARRSSSRSSAGSNTCWASANSVSAARRRPGASGRSCVWPSIQAPAPAAGRVTIGRLSHGTRSRHPHASRPRRAPGCLAADRSFAASIFASSECRARGAPPVSAAQTPRPSGQERYEETLICVCGRRKPRGTVYIHRPLPTAFLIVPPSSRRLY